MGLQSTHLNATSRFIWSGEIARDLSSSAFGLQWSGFNAIEHFPGGSCATFTLGAQVRLSHDSNTSRHSGSVSLVAQLVACFSALLPHSNPLIHVQGYAHGQFTSTFAGGSVAGSEMYENGVLLRALGAE